MLGHECRHAWLVPDSMRFPGERGVERTPAMRMPQRRFSRPGPPKRKTPASSSVITTGQLRKSVPSRVALPPFHQIVTAIASAALIRGDHRCTDANLLRRSPARSAEHPRLDFAQPQRLRHRRKLDSTMRFEAIQPSQRRNGMAECEHAGSVADLKALDTVRDRHIAALNAGDAQAWELDSTTTQCKCLLTRLEMSAGRTSHRGQKDFLISFTCALRLQYTRFDFSGNGHSIGEPTPSI